MLQFIRDRAKGWLAWVIVILIAVPFALWGVQEYFGGGAGEPVAEVNGVPIQQQELERAYYQQRQRLQQMMGDNFSPEMFPEQRLKRQVLQQMVEREYMAQTVIDRGFRLSDRQLAAEIRGVPAFQEDGQFSRESYERFLRSQGFSPADFEARLRRDLLAGQFQAGVTGSAFATDGELEAFVRLQTQQRDIGSLTVPIERFREQVTVSDDEVRAFYESNKASFTAPEQVKVAYLALSVDAIAEGVEVDEEQLRARYEARQENFQAPQERRARHILIEVDPDADDQAAAQAKAEAEEVMEKLDQGAGFAELAEQYSEDPGSAEQGGDLGFFARGVMTGAFEDAVFAMEPGKLRGPVRTDFGYHIIRLEEVRGGGREPFAEVRDQLRKEFKRSEAESRYYDMAEKLANLTFEQPDTLKPAAEALGLEIQESGWFSRDGGEQGITAEQKVVQAAFSTDVLEAGNNSEPVEIKDDRLVVVRVKDRRPERQLPLEDVKADIRERLMSDKATAAAEEAAGKAADRIAEGTSPADVAKELGFEWRRHEKVTRDAADGISPAILQAAFAMPQPQDGSPSTQVVPLREGDQAVVALLAVHSAESGADEGEPEVPREQALEEAAGEAEFASVVEGIRVRSEISVSEKNL